MNINFNKLGLRNRHYINSEIPSKVDLNDPKQIISQKNIYKEQDGLKYEEWNELYAKEKQLNYVKNQGFIGSIFTAWKICFIYFNSNGFEQSNLKCSQEYLKNNLISRFSLPRYRIGMIVMLLLASSFISYLFSLVVGYFWTALETKDQNKFQKILLWYLVILIINAIINCIKTDLSMRVQIDLRMWLTDLILKQYYSELSYYQFSIKKILDNPDQRIGEDIALFSSHLLILICRCIDNIFDFIVYATLLYRMNAKLFIAALIYSGLGTLITAKIGIDIILVKVDERKLESDFRYSIVRVRENAENVAMYGGSQHELSKHNYIMNLILENLIKKRILESKMGFFSSIFKYLIRILPIAVVSKEYFIGNIQLGKINQSSLAFNSVVEDVSILVNTFREISNLFSSVDRIGHFIKLLVDQFVDSKSLNIGEAILENVEKSQIKVDCSELESQLLEKLNNCHLDFKLKFPKDVFEKSFKNKEHFSIELNKDGTSTPKLSGKIRSIFWSEPNLKIERLSVFAPNSIRKILNDISFEVSVGDKILISGNSGVGKSSLLRAISGIWREGSGKIYRPPTYELFFIPQKPYCTHGSLKEQLLYPLEEKVLLKNNNYEKEDLDSYLIDVLKDVGLNYVFDRFKESEAKNCLDIVKDWSTTLSLGEQQRLAFARLIIFNPLICFLDEATSALDIRTEAKLYSLLKKKENLTYLSVGHRSSIEKFHNKKLTILKEGDIKLENI